MNKQGTAKPTDNWVVTGLSQWETNEYCWQCEEITKHLHTDDGAYEKITCNDCKMTNSFKVH